MKELKDKITMKKETGKGFVLSGAEYRFYIAKSINENLTDKDLTEMFDCNKSLVSSVRKKLATVGLVI